MSVFIIDGASSCFFRKQPATVFRILLILTAIVCFSCTDSNNPKQENGNKQEKQAKAPAAAKTADLTLAILPTTDCIPFIVAKEQGIYDSLHLNLRLLLYQSQLDAEKSVQTGKTDACASDIFRAIVLQNQRQPVKLLFATHRQWALVANKSLRASKPAQISSRMMAITRHSVPHYLSDHLSSQMNTSKGPLLLPQVNSLFIRSSMMYSGQIDAAILPQPQAAAAVRQGHSQLYATDKRYEGFAGICCNTEYLNDSASVTRLKALRKGYDLAVGKLIQSETLLLSDAMAKLFRTDSLNTLIKPSQSFDPTKDYKPEQMATALQWLKNRKQAADSYTTDTLLYHDR